MASEIIRTLDEGRWHLEVKRFATPLLPNYVYWVLFSTWGAAGTLRTASYTTEAKALAAARAEMNVLDAAQERADARREVADAR